MAKSQNKTQPGTGDVSGFIETVEHPKRREDAHRLNSMFQEVTGFKPVLWGSIVGYGSYQYKYASGREGQFLATGFSPRKASQSIYIMPGYQDYGTILERLGKHKLGKACLYVNRLEDIDLDVLSELVRTGLSDLDEIWPVQPS